MATQHGWDTPAHIDLVAHDGGLEALCRHEDCTYRSKFFPHSEVHVRLPYFFADHAHGSVEIGEAALATRLAFVFRDFAEVLPMADCERLAAEAAREVWEARARAVGPKRATAPGAA